MSATDYVAAAYVVVFVAWFVIVFTARYPTAMYDFVAGWLRFMGRVSGYGLLVVDRFPPFDGGAHPDHPIQVEIAPPQDKYSRLKAFFRLILAIPIYILQYVFQIWLLVVSIAIWFVAVVMGKTERGLTEAMRFPMSYYVRSTAYLMLMTDRYPPVADTETLPHLAQHPM